MYAPRAKRISRLDVLLRLSRVRYAHKLTQPAIRRHHYSDPMQLLMVKSITTSPMLDLSRGTTPDVHGLSRVRRFGVAPRGIYRFGPNREGQEYTSDQQAARPLAKGVWVGAQVGSYPRPTLRLVH